MKRVLISISLIFLFSFSAASIEVKDYSFETTYMPEDVISGEINLTIEEEPIDLLFSSNYGDEMSLKNFLDLNDADYNCTPFDCSVSYTKGSGSSDELFSVNEEGLYVGFYIKGEDVEINGLSFSIASDFDTSKFCPLKIEFFEDEEWEFDLFSEEYSSSDWGCYNPSYGSIGPLIRTSNYCELVEFYKSNSFFVGASVDEADSADLEMSVYTEDGDFIGDCFFNPVADEGCEIYAEDGEVFENGTYQVCVGAEDPTDYHIYEDDKGNNCGFVYSADPEDSVKDYAIFGRSAKYADASFISPDSFDFEAYYDAAESLIEDRYDGDCSEGCFLPIYFSGADQNLRVYNVELDYSKDLEDYVETKIYRFSNDSATVDFDGVLDLSYLEFNVTSEDDEYVLYLGDEELIEEEIGFLAAPILNSISPVNPPAGIPVTLYLDVDFNYSLKNLEYKWSFEDGVYNKTTDVNYVTYTFDDIDNYSLEVEVTYKNLTVAKSFQINAISPEESINATIAQRKASLRRVEEYIGVLSGWYAEDYKEKLNITYYEQALKSLEKAVVGAKTEEDYLDIAKELFSYDFPLEVYVTDEEIPFLLNDYEDIDPQVVLSFTGESTNQNLDDYKESIMSWQNLYIEASISSKKFSVIRESGSEADSLNYYSINLRNNGADIGYLFLSKPLSSLTFDGSSGASSQGDYSVIPLGPSFSYIDFYYYGVDDISYFASPKLSTFILEGQINRDCNFNSVCEPGENYETCRSDCKPYDRAIIYIILAFVLFLMVYTLLQIWYKNHYESYLFGGDKRQIYNLLMFVANARARGVNDSEIKKSLREQGWSSERIAYIMKKSYGKNVGMIEIIPISRVSAFFRNKQAKKNAQENGLNNSGSFGETLINGKGFRQQ